MKRKDAEVALRELDGFDWGGSVLRVGWSKAVPMAAKPLYSELARGWIANNLVNLGLS
jgi:U2-associated protein SR140